MQHEEKTSTMTGLGQLKARISFFKYLLIGGTSNIIAYGIYLALTRQNIEPMLSMSIVYLITCMISFCGNYQWTFASKRSVFYSMPRYLIAQGIGYATNALLLGILYYRLGIAHAIAQLIGVSVVAIQLYTINRFVVFK